MASVPFNNLITFSRGSNATLTGANGLIQYAPNNLVLNSEQFDNANWNKFNATINANVTAAPDGTATADALVENTTAGNHIAQQFISYASGLSYTLSFYVKAGTRSWARISMPSAAFGTEASSFYNLSGDGSLGVVSGPVTARTITAVGNGWYRITISATATATAGGNTIVFSASADNTSFYAGVNGAEALYLWGAQLELGSAATTYNSTTVKNLLGFSEAFDNAAWTKSNASIVTGAQANPVNGAFNAQKLMEDTSTNLHRVSQVPTLTAAAHTASIYAKSAGRNWLYMANASLSQAAYFNLNTGTIGTIVGAATATITPAGNGWYRCSITSTPSAGAQNYSFYTANADASFSYTGDGSSGVYIYGAQLSDSASLDPYVPTPAAAPSSTAYYGPRFDYDPVTLAPKGLLVEEARTNLVLTSAFQTLAGSAGSQYPSGTGWSNFFNTGGTRTYVASSVFTGAQAMDIVGVSAARNLIGFSFAAASSTTYTVSFYIESVSGVTGIVAYATGTLGTGGTTNNITAPTSTGRVSYTFTTGTGAGTVDLRFGIGAASNESGSIRISNVQCEAGAFATSYIPTVASTVTRSADALIMTGTNFSSWYTAAQGTFVANVDVGSVGSGDKYVLLVNDANGRVAYVNTASINTFDGTTVTSSGQSAVANTPFNVATAWGGSTLSISAKGAAAVNGAFDGTMGVGTELRIGMYLAGSAGAINGHIRSIDFIPARAADFQLQALTS